MSEETANATAATEEAESAAEPPGYDAENGRYIPYSGGCMGWFENSGVLASEEGNNYRFYTAMGSDHVRSTQFQRWGEAFNRRGSRRRVRRTLPVTVRWNGQEHEGNSKDLSTHGMRLQFLEELALGKGDEVTLGVRTSEGGAVELELPARVVWSQVQGRIRAVHNLGVMFGSLSLEQLQRLKELTAD